VYKIKLDPVNPLQDYSSDLDDIPFWKGKSFRFTQDQ
jgi:hypothetical protein